MPSQLKQILLTFSENTSFHGVSNASNETHTKWTRLAWMFAFTLMFVIYLYMLCGTLMTYYNYPTQTNVEYRITDAIKFPSVTICNSNVARYSAIIRNKYAMHVFKKSLKNEALPDVNVSAIDMINVTRSVAHQPEDMYLLCKFDGHPKGPCNVSREASWTMTSERLCHTFNSRLLITKCGAKITTRPGGDYGFDLVINIENYDYFATKTNNAGIQVLVHDPHVLPDVRTKGFAVGAGRETLVSVKKTVVMQLPEPYAKQPNLCENSRAPGYKNPLKFFTPYSMSACRQECQISHELSRCGCASYLHGGNTNVEICSFVELNCSSAARVEYIANPSIEANCGCHQECKETIYDVYVSSSEIDNDAKVRLLEVLDVPNLNINNFNKNIINLKIFFGEMRYTLIEQQSLYTWVSLFGELGGQLGLCLGASILTIAELLQLLGAVCAWLCKESLIKSSVADGPSNKSTIVDIDI